MNRNPEDSKINVYAFGPAIAVLAVFIFCGIFFQQETGNFLNYLLYKLADYFGWYINLLSLCSIFVILAFVVFRYGDIKIGGADAKPAFKTINWYFITIAGSLGTGILFWAMGEPIFHYAQPPIGAGVEPFSRESAIFAVSQAMWDWSFIQYSLYALCAVAFALMSYNLKKSLSFGSLIEYMFGRPIPWLTNVVHAVIIFCLCGAISNSMGVGLMQVGAGLEKLCGIPQSEFIWLIIAVCIGAAFTFSCVLGLARGLKVLANVKICIFMCICLFVVIFGDTVFIGKMGSEAVGDMIDNFGLKSTYSNVLAPKETWSADWIVQYFASFLVYAPVIGMFLSRMAKGHTVREFVIVTAVVPSVFCIAWIGIFGSMTMSLQTSGALDIWKAVHESGMQTTIFQILGSLPFGTLLSAAFIISTCISFCCLADPMASVLATLSVRRLEIDDEPPKYMKILMGCIMTTVAYLLVASGGVDSVKGMFTLVGLISTIAVIFCTVAAFKVAEQCLREKHNTVNIISDTEEA